jgi:hypothetical protein
MAISVAYGLLFGTLLTLVLLPSLLVVINSLRQRFYVLVKGEKISPEKAEPAIREDTFLQTYSDNCLKE